MNVRRLKRVVKRTLSSSPGWRLFGPLVRKPGVIVLTYHRILGRDRVLPGIPIEAFTSQMRWVRERCDPIAPADLADRARHPGRVRPPVLVTFDDGYRDYHDLAYPVLKALGIPALVFVATSFLDEGGMLWTDHVHWAVRKTRRERVKLPWTDAPFALPDERSRVALGDEIRGHLKKVPDGDRRAVLDQLLAELDPPPIGERQMLTWDEVRSTLDTTHYGGHSHTHPILSRLERADAITEIRTCRDRIAAETGRRPTFFAYPNGRPEDYTAETQEILVDQGFTTAFSTTEGIAGAGTDWMAVPRLPSNDIDIPDFAWIAAGLMRA
jgi:peptidoglycan/xylan/chitin deacetylase (PgdA/CDA1 family)